MSQITPLTPADRERFIASARSMVGWGFGHRRRGPSRVDCIGLVVVALQSVGRYAADRNDYGRNPANDGLRAALVAHFGPPIKDAPRAGDVALFRWGNAEENHVGILFDHPNGGLAIVHALAQAKRVIEHTLDDKTEARIAAVFRP